MCRSEKPEMAVQSCPDAQDIHPWHSGCAPVSKTGQKEISKVGSIPTGCANFMKKSTDIKRKQ